MKHLIRSTTIQGALVTILTLLLSLINVRLDADETRGIISGGMEVWPQIVAIFTALAAAWQRVQSFQFDKHIFSSRTFLLGVVTSALAVLSSAGVPTEGMQTLMEQILVLAAKMGPLFGSIMIIIGRVRAKTPIRIERPKL